MVIKKISKGKEQAALADTSMPFLLSLNLFIFQQISRIGSKIIFPSL